MNLEKKRILITRPRRQAGSFAESLRAAGADVVSFPVIEISPLKDTSALDRALRKLSCYEWLVLTSANGVQAIWDRLSALELAGVPAGVRVAAIGPKTAAALRARRVEPAFVPGEYVAEAILPGLGDLKDRWVLLPRADQARQALPQAIQQAGGIAHEITAYYTIPAHPDPDGLKALEQGVDVVTFTSSSTVRNFIALTSAAGLKAWALPGNPIFACIGPITADTARGEGLPVSLVANEYTTEGLIKALQAY